MPRTEPKIVAQASDPINKTTADKYKILRSIISRFKFGKACVRDGGDFRRSPRRFLLSTQLRLAKIAIWRERFSGWTGPTNPMKRLEDGRVAWSY